MKNSWYRGGLIGLAVLLSGLLWWVLHQTMPNVFIGGFAAVVLGAVIALLIASFWPSSKN
ncbi:hypothetical protein [Lacticaseibacillus manihotivorans]|uniref:Major facilitator superfamily (MFS) profile domain-containing protein n=2 Tax=Lacticaseibacillus manihotivorans TaxID=88233 RepID=A0A0R1R9V3_9LACO|nr:hypothetical protein [Lacticaseibacillus manihotivorans]KRL50981.1 hypothetical protein FD01_GL003017 [Lacticaseibacillus manihotivorans DSM 13343 = JCM 12514]QFQ90107.1 hypothetical protein LM010_01040 [Lacticaseibacillus manihotivorans]